MHFDILMYKCKLKKFNSMKISQINNVTVNKVISEIGMEWMDMASNHFMKFNYIAVRKQLTLQN